MTASPPPRPDPSAATAAGPVPAPPEVEDLLVLVHDTLSDQVAWQRAEAAAPDEPDVQSALHDRDLAARAGLVSAALVGLTAGHGIAFTAARAAGMAAWLRRRLAVDEQHGGGR